MRCELPPTAALSEASGRRPRASNLNTKIVLNVFMLFIKIF